MRIELPNPDGSLLADMYADVSIATGTPGAVVAVARRCRHRYWDQADRDHRPRGVDGLSPAR